MSSSFGIYLVGFIILIIGLALGAHLAGMPTMWIAVGVICLLGIGILSAVKKTQTGKAGRGTGVPPSSPPRY
jgi:tellurite resistance protein TehA-like permease